jgi:hypothetical protein
VAERGWMGVQMQTRTPTLAKALGRTNAHLASAVAEINQLAAALETV